MTTVPQPELFEVAVPDGTIRAGRWGPPVGDAPVLLAVHGITANLMSFAALVPRLGDVTIVAPDLRGRGGSRDITGPYSMAHHADDVTAVLDHLGVETATVLGHSVGGFVSIVAAHRHPERVERLLLIDGGLPLDLGAAAELPVDQLILAVIGPAAERLRMTFESPEAYLDYWRVHPSLGSAWSPWVEAYLRYDLVGQAPELRPACRVEAMEGDTESQLVRNDVGDALTNLSHPTVLVRAPRGLLDGDPLYTPAWVQQWVDQLEPLRAVDADDVNHYTIVISDHGADQLAALVREEMAAV